MVTLFFDIETTGLPKSRSAHWQDTDQWPRIVSIAWIIRSDSGEECRRYYVIRPDGYQIPIEAERIHGISTSYAVTNGVPWSQVAGEFLLAIEDNKVRKLVAHNIDFDRPILLAELFRGSFSTQISDLQTFCTMKGYAKAVGGSWPKLEIMYRKLIGESFPNAHNALADVEACAKCYPHVLKLLGEGNSEKPELENQVVVSDDSEDLIDGILDWASDKHWFDTSFVEKMQEIVCEGKSLTSRQSQALENIASRFSV